jgi:1,4-alpha-glucan branching enzyme
MKARLNKKISYSERMPRQLVHFEFRDVAARSVCIAGTFNDWHPSVSEMINMESGKWVKELELAPGTYEYRFVVDGRWVTDARCLHMVPNPFGEMNSLLVVPKVPKSTPARKRNSAFAAVLA